MLFQSTTEIYHPYPVLLTIPRYSYFLGSQEEKNKIQISLQTLGTNHEGKPNNLFCNL